MVELTVTGYPSTRTVKSVLAAVVLPRFSSYVNVNVVPAVFTAADWNVGAVVSPATVEPFVTGKFVIESKSVPELSCTALLVVDVSGVGAAYEIVTIRLDVITEARLSV